MHGIVYVPESEAPSDPLENEGKFIVVLLEGIAYGSRGGIGPMRAMG